MYRRYAANPVATQNSTYDAGRPTTMTEADLWPSASLEYDTLAPFPRSIALPLTNLNGGAKLRNLNTPSMPRVLQPTREWSITMGELSRPILLKLRPIATKASELHTLDAAQTPEEPPSQPIQPKPPYHIRSKAHNRSWISTTIHAFNVGSYKSDK